MQKEIDNYLQIFENERDFLVVGIPNPGELGTITKSLNINGR